MTFDINKLEWTRKPKEFSINEGKIEIITLPHTDLWQRTYYHFRNDNAPLLTSAVLLCISTVKTGLRRLLNTKMRASSILAAL